MIACVITAPIMVAISRQPEYSKKEKDASVRTKGRMIPIPQVTSIKEIERTIRGSKYFTHNILWESTSMGWKKRMAPPIAKTRNSNI